MLIVGGVGMFAKKFIKNLPDDDNSTYEIKFGRQGRSVKYEVKEGAEPKLPTPPVQRRAASANAASRKPEAFVGSPKAGPSGVSKDEKRPQSATMANGRPQTAKRRAHLGPEYSRHEVVNEQRNVGRNSSARTNGGAPLANGSVTTQKQTFRARIIDETEQKVTHIPDDIELAYMANKQQKSKNGAKIKSSVKNKAILNALGELAVQQTKGKDGKVETAVEIHKVPSSVSLAPPSPRVVPPIAVISSYSNAGYEAEDPPTPSHEVPGLHPCATEPELEEIVRSITPRSSPRLPHKSINSPVINARS